MGDFYCSRLKVYSNNTKGKLANIVRQSIFELIADHCTAVRNYLCTSFSTSTTVKRNFESNVLVKKEQEAVLRMDFTDFNSKLSHQ